MAGLQRSAVSFRRQGSSGLVWDDRFLSGELNQVKQGGDDKKDEFDLSRKSTSSMVTPVPPPAINTLQRSRSTGGAAGGGVARGYRAGKVSPAMEPPSPKVSACGFCGGFGKKSSKGHRKNSKQQPPAAPNKRRSR
ncbi:hypothetical protein MLD38_007974 [Melastoma candidum]|uniref:Uncharacterized protein n=1 Tax=Melastoma candidum TaxID=119954 RepID=A0ACB9RST1_9MYRT|nr:hypothetical protein MLD38_007974 [Melastoma candidum]